MWWNLNFQSKWSHQDKKLPDAGHTKKWRDQYTLPWAGISFCLGVRGNEVYSNIYWVNLVCFIIRNLKPKFLLHSHHNLYSVQTVKTKVLLKMSIWCDLHRPVYKRDRDRIPSQKRLKFIKINRKLNFIGMPSSAVALEVWYKLPKVATHARSRHYGSIDLHECLGRRRLLESHARLVLLLYQIIGKWCL